jgi:hypothetical protein
MARWTAEDGMMIELPTVLESELNPGPRHRDAVDEDVQKLVQARAGVRVWISASPNNARQHIDNCNEQIRRCSSGSRRPRPTGTSGRITASAMAMSRVTSSREMATIGSPIWNEASDIRPDSV